MLSFLLLSAATLSFGQNVPAYVPTNGLVGWWPFNGNANDESGNGNNGTVNGATLTSDRFGNSSNAYIFDGQNDFIDTPLGINGNFNNEISIGFWLKGNQISTDQGMITLRNAPGQFTGFTDFGGIAFQVSGVGQGVLALNTNVDVADNNWHCIVGTYNGNELKLYVDNQEIGSLIAPFSQLLIQSTFRFGHDNEPIFGNNRYLNGTLDDIGIWNRALTQQEITDLYNGNICYQTVSVTDTLFINTNITGFNPITYENTIRIWPNPTNDHITIDAGNLNVMNGYSVQIINSLGQQMFQTTISQQQYYLDLSTWTGNGMYFVHILDPNGNIIDIKKIVLR